jgi:hypothetical protein
MNKDQIKEIIKDEAQYFGWTYEKAIESLSKLNFTIESIIDNKIFDESKIRNSVAMAFHAFG